MKETVEVVLPEPYLIAIGKVCVQWGKLEMFVDFALKKLCNFELTDPRSAIVTAHMSWPMKMDIMESIINEYRETHPNLANFDLVKPRLTEAAKARNRIVHALWGKESDGQFYVLRATARGKLKTSHEVVPLTEIEALADELGRTAIEVYKTVFDGVSG